MGQESREIFEKKQEFLMEFNFECLKTIFDCLEVSIDFELTSSFEKEPKDVMDARVLANSRKEVLQEFQPYDQVFDSKYDFLPNLSILDLLFNEGPNAVNYLNNQILRI